MADKPKYKSQGSSLPYGAAGQINEAASAARQMTSVGPASGQASPPAPVQGPPLDLTPQNEIEAALFGPTRLPGQPITAGAPFGPGAMGTTALSDREATVNVLRQMSENPDAPEEVRRLLGRMELGA